MPRKIYLNAPPHHTLRVPSHDLELAGGERTVVPDEVAEELLTAPYADVREVEDVEDRQKLSREELNQLAEQAGVDDPGSLRNKDAVIAAIDEAEAAEGGEGPDNDNKED